MIISWYIVHVMRVSAYPHASVGNESGTVDGMCESFRCLESKQFRRFVALANWLLFFFCFFFFWVMALRPAVILIALYSLDKGPETGGLSHALDAVGFI